MKIPVLLALLASFSFAAGRPNVLFMISDDLNNFVGCYGMPTAKTPNIDKLASRGVRFERAYCTFPLCGPSRNSMLTGLYPNSTGILANGQIFRQTIPGHRSLPQTFRLQGWFSAGIGKLYHYNVPKSVGTDGHGDPASFELKLNPAGVDRLSEEPKIFSVTPGQFGASLSWYASPMSEEHHTDALLAKDAEWVLERCAHEKDRPFFLAVGFFRPHTPFVAPKTPYFDMHEEDSMPVVTGVKEDQADIPASALESRREVEGRLTEKQRRQCVQAYHASISFMDAQVGRVIDALDRLGLADNTIIVFTSDHGYHMGEHGLWQKTSLFEESARVPMLIVAPEISNKGGVAASPVSHLDLYPTLVELAGIKAPDNLQGQSLVPMLRDTDERGREWALSQVMRFGAGKAAKRHFGYSLRTPRWRYTEWDDGNRGRELYDHDADPKELTNLAQRPEHAETIADLSAKLRAAAKSTYPPNGGTPEVKPGAWAPVLTE